MFDHYVYNGVDYRSEYEVRQAIYKEEHKAFGKPKTIAEWADLGVDVANDDSSHPVISDIAKLKEMKLIALDAAFNTYRNSSDTFLVSSLGFRVNANVTAFDNVAGLVAQLQYKIDNGVVEPQVGFMTFDDNLEMLGLEEMKKIQVEISENGSNVYAQKWMLRQKIQSAQTEKELGLIQIEFVHTDFTSGI